MNYTPTFKVVGRCTSGVKVDGYVVQNLIDGTLQTLGRTQVEYLALNKQVVNCSAQEWNDRVYLKGISCKISALPLYNMDGTEFKKDNKNTRVEPDIEIVGRITNGKNIRGYVISLETPNGIVQKTIDRETVLELAKLKRIKNARTQRSNDGIVLRGVNCELAQLPRYKV